MAAESTKSRGWSWTKRAFLTGLATLLPTILTIALIAFAWGLLDNYVTQPVNSGVKWLLSQGPIRKYVTYPVWGIEPAPGRPDKGKLRVRHKGEETGYGQAPTFDDWLNIAYPSSLVSPEEPARDRTWLSGIGLVLGITIIFFAGMFFTSFLGRRIRGKLETEFYRVPVIKAIYPYAKQVTDFIFKEKEKDKFTQVVALEYPRKGLYSLGFVTGGGFKAISDAAGQRMINVFIPSSPTPITGYVIFVSEDEIVPLPITVDEAIRFAVSGGVLVPTHQVQKGTAVDFRSGRIAGISGRSSKD